MIIIMEPVPNIRTYEKGPSAAWRGAFLNSQYFKVNKGFLSIWKALRDLCCFKAECFGAVSVPQGFFFYCRRHSLTVHAALP